jgi:carbon-monoxide dehydrogenase large subunit
VTGERFIGKSQARKEDKRLLSGNGKFIADLRLPRALHAAFARSGMAHAKIKSIDTAKAKAVPGVIVILTAEDFAGHLQDLPGLQNVPPAAWRKLVENKIKIPDQPLLATDVVRHVGEPYAIVIAENRYIAEDAVELIEVDLDPLPVVVDANFALRADSPKIHKQLESNVAAMFRVKKGNVDSPEFARLNHIKRRIINHRFTAVPMECRGIAAEYDERLDAINIWSATQVVHWVRREVAKQLNLPEANVRCVAPDVGGGFGLKAHVYPEEIILPFIARRLRRPVIWIEDRQENLVNSTHSRDDIHDVEIIFDDEGRVFGLRDSFIKDSGAYTPVGVGAPSGTATHISALYNIPNLDLTATIVLTNKTPNAPYRGNGRPEATFVIERLLELVAAQTGIEPVEVRLRNMIQPEQMPFPVGIPYRDGAMSVYDSGDFPKAFRKAIDVIGGVESFRAEQRKGWSEGRYLGLGIGNYVEGTGAGPFEGATIRIDPSGSILVATGACSQGQSHETVFAQVAADEWGVDPAQVIVVTGDTAAIPYGWGTMASRSAVNSSNAIRLASTVLRRKVYDIAGHMLECDPSDLELRDGKVCLKGATKIHVTLRDIAKAGQPGWHSNRPPGLSGGLEATEYFEPETVTWAYGCHVGIVEVDAETGQLRIKKYVVTHDAGVLINPMVVDGQIIGGICQGIGGCLLERIVYDDQGQNLTATFADYLIPVAAQMPEIELIHFESPSPLNALGVKGLGEGGAVGPPAVLINGLCDALRPLGFELNTSFIDQSQIIAALVAHEASQKSANGRV